ncbi:hypothetical protein PIB30_081654, partial [Stylosanthes scabra]|nr:hypothetical protein [Stylosanthes scabra]
KKIEERKREAAPAAPTSTIAAVAEDERERKRESFDERESESKRDEALSPPNPFVAAVHGVTTTSKPPLFFSSKLPATQERDRTKTKLPLPPPNLSGKPPSMVVADVVFEGERDELRERDPNLKREKREKAPPGLLHGRRARRRSHRRSTLRVISNVTGDSAVTPVGVPLPEIHRATVGALKLSSLLTSILCGVLSLRWDCCQSVESAKLGLGSLWLRSRSLRLEHWKRVAGTGTRITI